MVNSAFENPSGEFFRLTKERIDKGLKASRESRRKRMILPIHRRQDAEVQRMINFLQPDTYIRPHRHPLPHATESIVLLKGSIRFFIFDESGKITGDTILKAETVPGVLDIEPGVWHSFLVLEPDTILFECKKGPYNAETDKEFAEWLRRREDPGWENGWRGWMLVLKEIPANKYQFSNRWWCRGCCDRRD